MLTGMFTLCVITLTFQLSYTSLKSKFLIACSLCMYYIITQNIFNGKSSDVQ
jgi:hypothetical protein